MDLPSPGSKILVIGVSGSGKTTFARDIAKLLHLKQVELDRQAERWLSSLRKRSTASGA